MKQPDADIGTATDEEDSSWACVTTGDVDESDTMDEQIASFACLMALLTIMFLSFAIAVIGLIMLGFHLWARLALDQGAFLL